MKSPTWGMVVDATSPPVPEETIPVAGDIELAPPAWMTGGTCATFHANQKNEWVCPIARPADGRTAIGAEPFELSIMTMLSVVRTL